MTTFLFGGGKVVQVDGYCDDGVEKVDSNDG